MAIYAASVTREGIDPVISLIADVALRPNLSYSEVGITLVCSFHFQYVNIINS